MEQLMWVIPLIRRWGSIWFFFKQKTAYDIVSRDWSSDVCSSDLGCSGCIACVGCVGCVGCIGCVGCVGLRGAVGQIGGGREGVRPAALTAARAGPPLRAP